MEILLFFGLVTFSALFCFTLKVNQSKHRPNPNTPGDLVFLKVTPIQQPERSYNNIRLRPF
ncbi:unknown protein [Desulfotalea psychrophila LSv54]|uniref:Uncharacterized protein n=1 Tax=Desulfotalea psychrophila (strain LSv54 / DSM 12343) TaxID=177439 RepID=Q6ALG2_DESPS|nr:unknown protein [Desulfotalea psychrophila LSv54]